MPSVVKMQQPTFAPCPSEAYLMNKSYTILYVDDDHDDLMLIADAFERYTDYLKVVHAHNGLEGLSMLKKMQDNESLPCLVIIDINMPKMDGKEMLRTIRSNKDFQNLPVILFSTSNSEKDKDFAESLDADFITKPVSFPNLESLIAEFVSKCQFEAAKTA